MGGPAIPNLRSRIAPGEATWVAPDGVGYRVRRWGGGQTLVFLHGFTGDAGVWSEVSETLASRWHVLAVDLLGHGESDAPREAERYRVDRQVDDLAGLVGAFAAGQVAVVGYSMGARLALAFAVAHPGLTSCLVLEGGTGGIESEAERTARRGSDEELAASIERDGIEAFVERWERLPIWASQAALPEEVRARQRAIRLRQRPRGLAGSLRGFGQGVAPPLWDALRTLPMPVLAVAGELDRTYADLVARIADCVPRGRSVVLDGAGHAPHLERPAAFLDAVESFLATCSEEAEINRGGA